MEKQLSLAKKMTVGFVMLTIAALLIKANLTILKNAFINSPLATLYIEQIRDGKSIDKDHVVTTLDNGMPIVVNKNDRCVCWFVRLTGHWDSNEEKALDHIVKKDFKIVEVGSNFGVHTLTMAKKVGENGKVYAFEANPYVSKYLKISLQMNNLEKIVTLYEKAAGEQEGESHLVFGSLNIGGGHLIKEYSENAVKTHIVRLDDTIDIQKNDLLKIDAEGYEFKILMGAKKIIEANISSIIMIIEWDQNLLKNQGTNIEDFIDFLKHYKLNLWKVGNQKAGQPALMPITYEELKNLSVGDIVTSRQQLD